MKIALIGATGFVGSHILQELTARNHEVVAIVRNISRIPTDNNLVIPLSVNVLESSEVAAAVTGTDAVISAYNPGWTNPNIYTEFLDGSRSIQEGVKASGVTRLLVIGGAGSLEIKPGVQLIDTPKFPEAFKPGASAAREYLEIIKQETELDWTYLSPAIEMNPGTSGTRTGHYRTDLNKPVFNEAGHSTISVEDLAVAIVDEIEQSNHIKERFTVGY
ncbi:NAD(P)-dependent oxidoreductase [Dyadobacter aurulentus]|uniref:NAD(P)-dependent oxidoreductase n=1 Tax=Dyadobacter sp. UC 10 TaxID=2605428 RepID=UPI0011F188F0|nr:NAD(P)-dependent oxidoreductase [Dyadobacter sp. UC 10]KAA0993211.1 NAD(P)-dependent oxidoreductase [Dyadobacter sp. UC 10]